jgi:PAS domain S-box-containing protein
MESSHYASDLDPSSVLSFGSALPLLEDAGEVGRLLTGTLRSMGLADLQAVVLGEALDAGPQVVGSVGTAALPEAVVADLRRVEAEGSVPASAEGGRLARQRVDVTEEAYPALAAQGLRRLTVLRLGTEDSTYGVLVAGHVDPAGHAPVDDASLQMMAAQVSMALHRLQVDRERAAKAAANEQLSRQAQRLEAFRDVDRAILAAESPREIASVAARRAQTLMPCERVSVALFDWDTERVTVLAAQQEEETILESGAELPLDAFTVTDALKEGRIDDMPDFEAVPSTPITDRLRAAGIRSAITVPMQVEGTLIGTVNLGATEPEAFGEDERRIGRELADHLAIALRQARLMAALQAQREQLEDRVAARTAELRDANATLKDEVDERRRAERALRKSQARLTRIIDSAIDAIISVNANLEIDLFNEAAEAIFQCAVDTSACTSLEPFLTDALERLVREHIEAHRAGEAEGPAASGGRYLAAPEGLEARRADGETFPVEATLCPVELPGEDQYLLILRDLDDLRAAEAEVDQLQSENTYLQEEIKSEYNFDEIVGTSEPMQAVYDAIERVAETGTTVLITGETGTGKELVARALHNRSGRADQVFVKVNCAALSSDLIESELFGHERGAFTGATAQREGRFELADGGTLLLDEIGELPLDTQAKLLRALQHQEFERVGGSETMTVDTRILAATNRDLEAEVEAGRFRSDLFYRLNIFPIELPPLRERPGDIPLLAKHFCDRFCRRAGTEVTHMSDEAMAALRAYDWPGNVRELANIMERAVILTPDDQIRAEHLSIADDAAPAPEEGDGFPTLDEAQRRHIADALARTDGVVGGEEGAAQLLGMKRTTLLSRMDRLGIDPDDYR